MPKNLFKLFTRYSDHFLSRWTVLSLDILLVWLTYMAAQIISANFQMDQIRWAHMPQRVALLTLVYGTAFFLTQSYVGVVRHGGSKDFQRLFNATFISILGLIPIAYLLPQFSFRRVTLIVHAMLFLITSVGGRLSVCSLFLSLQLSRAKKGGGILIFGAGSMGRAARSAIFKR